VGRNGVTEARWEAIRDRILANAGFLGRQGALNAKVARRRVVYRLRFRVPDRGRRTQKNIYIGDDPDLVARTRQLLQEIRRVTGPHAARRSGSRCARRRLAVSPSEPRGRRPQ